MDIERFHILTQPQKSYYTQKMGVFLCCRQNTEALIQLYAVNNYYVEIIFPLRFSTDLYVHAFSSMAKLEPYLTEIDIDCLFQ
jgi:hypothetical protein